MMLSFEFLRELGVSILTAVGLVAIVIAIFFAVRLLWRVSSIFCSLESDKPRAGKPAEIKKPKNIVAYISTPINGREGATLQEKFVAARNRAEIIERGILSCSVFDRPCAVISTFDESDGSESESEAMGRCIRDVIDCDIVIVDDSDPKALANSNGCRLEMEAARLYKKNIVKTSEYGI